MASPSLALVLHAHLPYVRHPEHPRSLEERWFFEALWESYLPILAVLDRLAADGVRAPFALSISPPLAAMLRDPLLGRRFEAHLDRTEALAVRAAAHLSLSPSPSPSPSSPLSPSSLSSPPSSSSPFLPALAFHRQRLQAARAAWQACAGDLLGALRRHADAGRLELLTTAATHAFLPGLLPTPASIRAQIRLGRAAFGALVAPASRAGSEPAAAPPPGFWLPECAWDPRLDPHLAAAGVRYTVLDAHALALATPPPPQGTAAPVLTPAGVACFPRDPISTREVWSRDQGYPGHPRYREFYRDAGFDLPEQVLGDELGPDGLRLMTGLKLHRVTGPGPDKAPYDPEAAADQARLHAAEFVARRREHLARLPRGPAPPILVAAYDAELFGHWWLEGPLFLEHALRGCAAAGVRLTTPGSYLDHVGPGSLARAQPAASTWGEGGWGTVWIGPRTARLWRHVHHAEAPVLAAIAAVGANAERRGEGRGSEGQAAGRALSQAIRELLLLQASDWAFMLDRGEMAQYAEARVRAHAGRVRRLVGLAGRRDLGVEEAAWVDAAFRATPFLAELPDSLLQEAFEAWAASS